MKQTQYRAVWPNGTPCSDGPYDEKEEFFQSFDDNNLQYEKMGMPEEFRPRVQVREVEVIEHDWMTWKEYADRGQQVAPMTSGPEYVNQVEVPTGKHALEVPQPWQIEQVRKKAFGWSDPCIICGQKFQTCVHNHSETAVYVEYIKKGPWFK